MSNVQETLGGSGEEVVELSVKSSLQEDSGEWSIPDSLGLRSLRIILRGEGRRILDDDYDVSGMRRSDCT